jgi:hypothetical protein
LVYHRLECDEFWLIERHANKQEPKGRKRDERNREKQAGNTKEIKKETESKRKSDEQGYMM